MNFQYILRLPRSLAVVKLSKGQDMGVIRGIVAVLLLAAAASVGAAADGVFTLQDAIRRAVRTHPSIGEATANRRATDAELRQSQGVLLPQIRLDVFKGAERRDLALSAGIPGNNTWRDGYTSSVVVRQLLFDGFASLNQVWRQTARVESAAYRVRERSELTALDAAEAYIDVVRYSVLIRLAQDNLAAHQIILKNVRARYAGGRSGEGDLQQAQERVSGAQAALAEFKVEYDSARARYRNIIGIEPTNLRFPGRVAGLPRTRDEALALAWRDNATLRAAGADAKAARYDFESSKGNLTPSIWIEGRATRAQDSDFYAGSRDELSGKFVMSWDVFRGGIDTWRRSELGERYIESQQRQARLQRATVESIEKAWSARTITEERIASLRSQINAGVKVLQSYRSEYELGQRTLIDLLNAQTQLFNAQVSHVSALSVAVFADVQLLAAAGQVLIKFASEVPIELASGGDPVYASLLPKPQWLTPRQPPEDTSYRFVPPNWISELQNMAPAQAPVEKRADAPGLFSASFSSFEQDRESVARRWPTK